MKRGLCECGCGRKTTIATSNHKRYGYIKGKPKRFIIGHGRRWRGEKPNKYRVVNEGLPKQQQEHRHVAELALGKPLDCKHPVHHVNEIKSDNRNRNLVICEDQKYHRLLHYRSRALAATGNPNAKYCYLCKGWDLLGQNTMRLLKGKKEKYIHTTCQAVYDKGRYDYAKELRNAHK